jgi:hypothetical protein
MELSICISIRNLRNTESQIKPIFDALGRTMFSIFRIKKFPVFLELKFKQKLLFFKFHTVFRICGHRFPQKLRVFVIFFWFRWRLFGLLVKKGFIWAILLFIYYYLLEALIHVFYGFTELHSKFIY